MEWVLLKIPLRDVLQFTKNPIAGGDVMGISNPGSEGRSELVKKKAYELYLQRGKAPGHEMEDWLAAEKIVDRELQDSKGLHRPELSQDPPRPQSTPLRSPTPKMATGFKR
jgi:hypothetical protein